MQFARPRSQGHALVKDALLLVLVLVPGAYGMRKDRHDLTHGVAGTGKSGAGAAAIPAPSSSSLPSPSPSQRLFAPDGAWDTELGKNYTELGKNRSAAGLIQENSSASGMKLNVIVVGPGGGASNFNSGPIYASLDKAPGFSVVVMGQSQADYDRYPAEWPNGGPEPNLKTFASAFATSLRYDLAVWNSDARVLVLGSRGGQVVLPELWARFGDTTPPAVVINGGCARRNVQWPRGAVTFLLMGGQDYFKGQQTDQEYIESTLMRLHPGSRTTALLYVKEMAHMPDKQLLSLVLPKMLHVLAEWAAYPHAVPEAELFSLADAMEFKTQLSGWLVWTGSDQRARFSQQAFGRTGTLVEGH